MRNLEIKRVIDDGEFIIGIQPPYPTVDLEKYDVYWSVYERFPEGHVNCVGDFITRKAAEEFVRPLATYNANVPRTSTIDEWIDANTPYDTIDHDSIELLGLPSPDPGEEYATLQDRRLYLTKVELVIAPSEEDAFDTYRLTVSGTPYSLLNSKEGL